MINFKLIIGEKIANTINEDINEIASYIEVPPNKEMGDYAFPCFKLAKTLKKAPPMIAEELKNKIEIDENIEKIEIAGGYLNFYINKLKLSEETLKEFELKQERYGSSAYGDGKNVIVEFSSPNIAKPFHIGHLRTTVIGSALYNVYKFLGYNTTAINHLGDYGTQFGKLIEGYKRWGNEYNIDENPIDELMKIYVRINELCKEDESVLEACRENFRLLEENDEYCKNLWEKFRDVSLKEFQRIYDLLGVHFDSLKGEAFYTDKMDEVENILEKAGVITESQGSKIVDLEDKGLGVCIIRKSNGSSIYATRDLAAIRYRAKEYDFDKCLYVVAYEQALHFRQIFEVAKHLDIPEKCQKGLEHVQYGMTRLTTGKMSTREGNVIKVEDLLKESIERVEHIIEEKNPEMENKKAEAKKIGIGAVIFNNLCTTLIKDQVFDWNAVLNFNGETGPYIQYVYVRTKSVLEKAGYLPSFEEVDVKLLQDKESLNIISNLYEFENVLKSVVDKNETSFLTRYLIELGQSYSNFYNENKIICEDNKKLQDARVYLSVAVGTVLKTGAKLLGIEMPNKM
ncbi:MAG: arginine--tRNA ligase [Clostridia bacterium]|jgi:arginyl-tRNA synthetase|nr:arginine--tRNA ligase [Clostridia bacterium]